MYASVWRQDSERSCMRVSGVSYLTLFPRFLIRYYDRFNVVAFLFLTLLMNVFYDDYFQLILFSLSMGCSTKLEMILCTILTDQFTLLVLKFDLF